MKTALLIIGFISIEIFSFAQAENTVIRGFMDVNSSYSIEDEKFSFGLGEQDLFITSDISDKVSFLGETVFKYDANATTKFSISLERAIFKYNYKGNHSFFAGKVHTALNYWNDTYHHGRLFFPTVGRPELFNQNIIPLHTTGIGFSGQDLTDLKFGYTAMVGNGLGSADILDNNLEKSIILAAYMKPIEDFRIGVSAYFDKIGGSVHNHSGNPINVPDQVTQRIYSGSVAYFGDKVEFLAEGSLCNNSTDSLKNKMTNAMYVYAGYRIKDMVVPYIRFDYIDFDEGEMYFTPKKTNSYTIGVRYEMNYLTAIKLEYQYKKIGTPEFTNNIFLQIAIGF